MDINDLYRFRAEDFARRWENHRRIEWQTNFQVYAGYAAIAVSFSRLQGAHGPNPTLGYAALAATALLYGTSLYLFKRIQERLHYNGEKTFQYIGMLHTSLGIDRLPRPLSVRRPMHPRWYAFGAQAVLTTATALGLAIYVSPRYARIAYNLTTSLILAVATLIFCVFVIVNWFWKCKPTDEERAD